MKIYDMKLQNTSEDYIYCGGKFIGYKEYSNKNLIDTIFDRKIVESEYKL